MRIKHSFYSAHQTHASTTFGLGQKDFLCETDPMFARDFTTYFPSFLIHRSKNHIQSTFPLLIIKIVSQFIDMKISVACVTETHKTQGVGFLKILTESDELSDTVTWNNYVTLLYHTGRCFDRFQKGSSCRPD